MSRMCGCVLRLVRFEGCGTASNYCRCMAKLAEAAGMEFEASWCCAGPL